MINKTEIRTLTKRKLGIAEGDTTHDDIIDYYIDEVESRVLLDINHEEMPDGLKYTWVGLVAAALTAEQSAVLFPSAEEEEAYETNIGDTTVKQIKSPVTVKPERATLKVIDGLLFDYRQDLSAYRRMRW